MVLIYNRGQVQLEYLIIVYISSISTSIENNNQIDSSNREKIFLRLLSSTLIIALFVFMLLSFFKSVKIFNILQEYYFQLFKLGVFSLMVFHQITLNIGFCNRIINKLISLRYLLVYFVKEKNRYKTGFYLDIDNFLCKLFFIIYFLTLQFYLSCY